MSRSAFWEDLSAADFADAAASQWIAVLPVAAIEQHGPHLPLSTDTVIARGLVQRVAELLPKELPAVFLPVQCIGKSDEHIDVPGTLTLSWETATRAWIEIGESVHRAGVRKLLIVTSHGGNVQIMDIVTRELRVKHGMLAAATSWARMGAPEGAISAHEKAFGIHGGEDETSLMLALAPQLVRMEFAADFKSAQENYAKQFAHLRAHGPAQFGWLATDLNAKGVMGNAAAATAEKGRVLLDHRARAFIELLKDMHTFDISNLRR